MSEKCLYNNDEVCCDCDEFHCDGCEYWCEDVAKVPDEVNEDSCADSNDKLNKKLNLVYSRKRKKIHV